MSRALGAKALDLRTGVRIEVVTVAWMVVEAALAIGSGVLARSALLTAFGIDSLIELISGSVLLWRLVGEARGSEPGRTEQLERRAARISALLLVLLCGYIIVTVTLGLITRTQPEKSWVGIGVSLGAILVMPLLARSKRRIAERIGSPALRADAAESITCAYMAGAVLAGVVLNAALGWWWAEYMAAPALLFWLFGETREAFEAARGGTQDDDDD